MVYNRKERRRRNDVERARSLLGSLVWIPGKGQVEADLQTGVIFSQEVWVAPRL